MHLIAVAKDIVQPGGIVESELVVRATDNRLLHVGYSVPLRPRTPPSQLLLRQIHRRCLRDGRSELVDDLRTRGQIVNGQIAPPIHHARAIRRWLKGIAP